VVSAPAESLEQRCLPAVTFSVVFDDPVSLHAAYYDSLELATISAGEIWASYLDGTATIEIKISFADIPTANGGSAEVVFLEESGGFDIFQDGASAEIRTGIDPNGATPDINITVGTDYLIDDLFLDPTPETDDDIPFDKQDAIGVMLHEIGHALGFNGWHDDETGALPADYASTFDRWVVFTDGNLYFTGPLAQASYGGPVPLTFGNSKHVGNSLPRPGSELLTDLMNGVVGEIGIRLYPSELNLAILADCAVPLLPGSLPNNAPVVADQSFTVPEQSANGTVVGNVIATDPDAGQSLSWVITAGNDVGAFAINSTTGTITVANGSLLDLESQATYLLTVTVTDNATEPESDAATITITLEPKVLSRIETSGGTTSGAKTLVDTGATFEQGNDLTSLDGSVLAVEISAGAQTGDKLLVKNAGSKVKAKKGGVFKGKTRIGDVTGGQSGAPLVIEFNSSASLSDAQLVARSILFQTKKKAAGSRTVSFQFFNSLDEADDPTTKEVLV